MWTMELNIRNIGKIGLADVVIDGITVIGGQKRNRKNLRQLFYQIRNSFLEYGIWLHDFTVKKLQ